MTVKKAVFDSNGVQIAFYDTGTAAIQSGTVLLIHGFASNLETNWVYTSWIKRIEAAGYRVVALDNRGHGDSEKLYGDADYGAPTMAEDARRLLDHLDIPAAHIMGYSMGARICAFLAINHPERVRSVVFAGMGYNLVRGIGAPEPIAKGLLETDIQQITHPTVRSFRLFAESTKSDLKALAACIRSTRRPVQAEQLAHLPMPVLVAVGTEDVIAGSAHKLADLIPGAQVLDIPGKDHMKAVGDPVFKEGVLAFWKKIR